MTKYQIEVDRDTCIACGICYNTDPRHFEADRQNQSAVVGGNGYVISMGTFDDDYLSEARAVMIDCSVEAIKIKLII